MNQINREQQLPAPSYPSETILTAVLGSLQNGQKLVKPILVRIEKDGDEVLLVERRFSSIYASAPAFSEAVEVFKRIFVDELDELLKDEEQLGPRLQEELQFLRSHIIEANS